MRRSLSCLALGLAVGWAAAAGTATAANEPATCGNYGTSVHFEKSPSEAAKKALKEEKLVFVLHVSGLFEEPDFT
jgi:hypothetical protein